VKKKVHKITPSPTMGVEKIFYIENHIAAGIPLDIIAYRLNCNLSDIERIAKRRESDAHIQNIG
jgi:hypothetical protein